MGGRAPGDTGQCLETVLVVTTRASVLLVPSGYRPGMLTAETLQCAGRPPPTQNCLVQNVSGAKDEKPWLSVTSKIVAGFTCLTFTEPQVPTSKAANNVYVSFLHYREFQKTPSLNLFTVPAVLLCAHLTCRGRWHLTPQCTAENFGSMGRWHS